MVFERIVVLVNIFFVLFYLLLYFILCSFILLHLVLFYLFFFNIDFTLHTYYVVSCPLQTVTDLPYF